MPKRFNPKDMITLDPSIFDEVIKKGFAYMTLPNGLIKKVTKENIYLSHDELMRLQEILKQNKID